MTAATPRPAVAPVPLRRLAALIGIESAAAIAVTGVTHDSSDVIPGDLFAALPGATHHGANFVAEAAAAGAVAVLTDHIGGSMAADTELAVLTVDTPRSVLGAVAAEVYGTTSGPPVLGVTGTNGKTTVVHMLEAGLAAAGDRCGVIGTLGARVGDQYWPGARTTPEAPQVHAILAVMRQAGASAVAMEVSSHALSLHRVDGVRFAVAGFTNLAHDHLDFHGGMSEYFAAKARLFEADRADCAVICVDTEAGAALATQVKIPVTTVSAAGAAADVSASIETATATGSVAQLDFVDGRSLRLSVPIPGEFNVANAAVAIAMLDRFGVDPVIAADGIAAMVAVPGRMEPIEAGQPFSVVVDYAHTPDALERVLGTVRGATNGRVIAVFGCGGDRDAAKRPEMGAIAARLADVVVVTDDNPRSEEAAAIRAAIVAGAEAVDVRGRAQVSAIADRRAAISEALSLAAPGDMVVIAGKGAEQGQEVAGVVTPFDDRDETRRLLAEAGWR